MHTRSPSLCLTACPDFEGTARLVLIFLCVYPLKCCAVFPAMNVHFHHSRRQSTYIQTGFTFCMYQTTRHLHTRHKNSAKASAMPCWNNRKSCETFRMSVSTGCMVCVPIFWWPRGCYINDRPRRSASLFFSIFFFFFFAFVRHPFRMVHLPLPAARYSSTAICVETLYRLLAWCTTPTYSWQCGGLARVFRGHLNKVK